MLLEFPTIAPIYEFITNLEYPFSGTRVVGDGRFWQEPPLAPAREEHCPWLLRSSDPGSCP